MASEYNWPGYKMKTSHEYLIAQGAEAINQYHFKVTNLQSFILAFSICKEFYRCLDRYLKDSIKVSEYLRTFDIDNYQMHADASDPYAMEQMRRVKQEKKE